MTNTTHTSAICRTGLLAQRRGMESAAGVVQHVMFLPAKAGAAATQ